jgi:hypothetical protein
LGFLPPGLTEEQLRMINGNVPSGPTGDMGSAGATAAKKTKGDGGRMERARAAMGAVGSKIRVQGRANKKRAIPDAPPPVPVSTGGHSTSREVPTEMANPLNRRAAKVPPPLPARTASTTTGGSDRALVANPFRVAAARDAPPPGPPARPPPPNGSRVVANPLAGRGVVVREADEPPPLPTRTMANPLAGRTIVHELPMMPVRELSAVLPTMDMDSFLS